METSTEEQQKAINQIYDYAASLVLKEKKSYTETKAALIAQGIDEESASTIVTNLEEEINGAKKKQANKDMRNGALWCVGGIIVTAVTYSNASGGGTYVVTWGAIIFGAVQFFKGLFNASS